MVTLKKLISIDYYIENFWRLIFSIAFISIPVFSGAEGRDIFFGAISDAYLQVSVFVALTLFVFYGLETWLKLDTAALLKKYKKYQVPISAILGALPGCGGAIVVMTQYTLGRLGFGSVIAVLTATMGDAAFLLLAQRPMDALIVFAVSISVGIIFGYLIEWIHGYDYLRHDGKSIPKNFGTFFEYGITKSPWVYLLVPGLIAGLFTAFQAVEIMDDWFASFGVADFSLWLGVVGAALSVFLWVINPTAGTSASNAFVCKTRGELWDKVVADTAFVSAWVILGYLAFDLGVFWTGVDLQAMFSTIKPVLPLIAVLLGFIPGCGPQVLVTTMYLQGIIPFSAQLGNAISNDGDALFPAIALAPKVSVVATLYTAIPALLVGYGYYFFFET